MFSRVDSLKMMTTMPNRPKEMTIIMVLVINHGNSPSSMIKIPPIRITLRNLRRYSNCPVLTTLVLGARNLLESTKTWRIAHQAVLSIIRVEILITKNTITPKTPSTASHLAAKLDSYSLDLLNGNIKAIWSLSL